jgi:hypothetical protein
VYDASGDETLYPQGPGTGVGEWVAFYWTSGDVRVDAANLSSTKRGCRGNSWLEMPQFDDLKKKRHRGAGTIYDDGTESLERRQAGEGKNE